MYSNVERLNGYINQTIKNLNDSQPVSIPAMTYPENLQ